MAQAFVGVGSNIDPDRNVLEALRRLAGHTRIAGISTVYRTPALGRSEQADYYNCVLRVDTELAPVGLKRLLNRIESDMGRRRTCDKYAARNIDLDLLVYDDLVLATSELVIPDPDILSRAFLAAGLNELAPGMLLPRWGRTISAIAADLPTGSLRRLGAFTASLRAAIQGTSAGTDSGDTSGSQK